MDGKKTEKKTKNLYTYISIYEMNIDISIYLWKLRVGK